jgi:TnpA family transposase
LLESGHTTTSVALRRLVGCTAKNCFYRANRDLGRIFKTEFLLGCLSEPQLRARIRRSLLKVEQLHVLWHGMCITGGGAGSTPANCTNR